MVNEIGIVCRKKEREQEGYFADEDIAEMALAHLNIHGPEACAVELRGWRPREVSYRVGCIVARRLVDHGRYDDLDQLAAQPPRSTYTYIFC